MRRDNTAYQPTAPDTNDTRDTPLSRLLRKSSPAPEAPVDASLSGQPAAPEVPVGRPPDAPTVSQPQPTAAKPPAVQVSVADMLVSKLRAKEFSAHKPLRPQPAVPEVVAADDPVDVEYTPVEAPAGKPDVKTEPAAAARDTPPAASEAAPPPPAAKPVAMRGVALETSLINAPRADVSAKRPTVAEPAATQAPKPEAAATASPRSEPAPQAPVVAARVEDAVHAAPKAEPPARPSASAPPAFKPADEPGSVHGGAVGGLLPKPSAAPESSADEPSQGKSLVPEKSAGKLLRLPRRTRDEREFLPAALEIVDTPPSPVGRAIGFTIIAVAVIAIAWACIGQVDIVATAGGRIVPQGKTKIVQPVDTGIVTGIHVADGDHVKAGDVLIELNSIQNLADRDRFARDLLQADLNLSRLRGLAATLPGTKGEGKQPNLVGPPKDAKPEDIALTQAAMRAQATNESAKLADLDQQIESKQAEAAEADASVQKLQASLPMLADQEKLLRAMRDQKIGSKLDWYQVNQQLIEQQHEIGVLAHRKDAAEAAQRALKEQREAEASQYQMQVLADLDKARTQASELQAELAKAEQRSRQGVLTAPIAGTVQQLAIHTIGGVVTPAEALLAIVPDEGGLVVEAAVQNRDVGFISAGQTVRIKVEAFNFTLYGLIDGKVLDVTRDTVSHPADDKKNKNGSEDDGGAASDQSGPVYLARIALSQDWMMTENGKVSLTPGMAVTAEIQTGERRLISYLLSPLIRHVSESMHER
ncbi:MAG TPA: HlyD family type I secretion periplasmic adaptor subunit [Dongiaceae bacterium]